MVMSLRPWNSGDPFRQLRYAMNRLFEDYEPETPPPGPAVTAWEQADGFTLEAEVPGLGMDDLEITCQGPEITLRGEWKAPVSGEGTVERQERFSGRFERTLTLPADVDSERIRATLEDGVLRIEMPKSPAAKPRKIEVRSAHEMPARIRTQRSEGKES
jgi:HSP20 family protein